MIKTNVDAFENLKDLLFSYSNINSESGRRYISTNEIEKKWLIETEILEVINILPDVMGIVFEFQDSKFVCLIGSRFLNHTCEMSVLEEYPFNAGLMTVFLAEKYLKINPTISFLEFEDNIMSQHLDAAYKGHNYEDFLNYLEPIQLFLINENSLIKNEDIYRILTYIYSNSSENLILKFEYKVLSIISEISLVGSRFISYNLILSALLSTTYKHSFLELYRLVERLFPLNYLKIFYEKSLSQLSFLDFSSELENSTSWKPREDEAVEKIFSSFKISTKEAFNDFYQSINYTGENPHKYFYKLRNSIVHFRANHEELDLEESQWNLLILATLTLVDEQYSFYNNILK
ncbi:hypothetical protein [Flavobacterium anhuiense]|uniref:hypothetical protein n=1 Tax=Flavobacterium anhuiense TaxID=459526 RepID=UPI0013C42A3D|nr:hypothetical protein [Flavobacterium anhuiense]